MVLCSLDLKSTPSGSVGRKTHPRFREGAVAQAETLALTSTERVPIESKAEAASTRSPPKSLRVTPSDQSLSTSWTSEGSPES